MLGTYSEYEHVIRIYCACLQVVHPADLCFKLPDNVSLEEGAMCEPLSVGVHACHRANIGPEMKVLVMGAGPIGLVTLLAARAFGAPKVIIADVDDHRLSVAKSLGADDIVKVSRSIQVCSYVLDEEKVYYIACLLMFLTLSFRVDSSSSVENGA